MGRTVWYPGHMARGGRKLGELVDKLDLIIEVRDARAPFSTSSPLIAELSRVRPVLTVLSKKDLALSTSTRVWLDDFAARKTGVWALDLRRDTAEPVRRTLLRQKPAHRELRLAVVGIPNVGKSMFLNLLVGRANAKVGGIPGITRNVSWYRGNGFLAVDSPGILDPHSEPGVHLVLSWLGCARADVLGGYETAALELIRFLRRKKLWGPIKDVWGVEELDEEPELTLARIGRRLGCLVAGGEVNLELAGRRLVDGLAAGKIGPLTLELPGDPI